MRSAACILLLIAFGLSAEAKGELSPRQARKRVEAFVAAVQKINEAHRTQPKDTKEAELAEKLPRAVRGTLDALLTMADGEDKWACLVQYGEAARDLDLSKDLERIEKALRKSSPGHAKALGHHVSRERFLLHALRVNDEFAEQFADALDGVFEAYDKTFGFTEFSKIPGKKVRVLLHKESKPKPPHFGPEFPFHSLVDFPVVKDDEFTSPTRDGRFLFYGLCHELGHLIVMWGDRRTEEDHHAWAHYTGVTIVDACAKAKWAKKLLDKRSRSLEKERKKLAEETPSLDSHAGVMRLLIELHDLVGPKKIGEAFNHMDGKRMGRRINYVRYYWMKDFEKALLAVKCPRKKVKKIKRLFQQAR